MNAEAIALIQSEINALSSDEGEDEEAYLINLYGRTAASYITPQDALKLAGISPGARSSQTEETISK